MRSCKDVKHDFSPRRGEGSVLRIFGPHVRSNKTMKREFLKDKSPGLLPLQSEYFIREVENTLLYMCNEVHKTIL
jgi:hypothetical protein